MQLLSKGHDDLKKKAKFDPPYNVHQAITKAGKFTKVNIDKQMISDVRMSSRRRRDYLDARRSEKSDEARVAETRKRKAAALKELEVKKKLDEEAQQAKRSIDEEITELRKLQFLCITNIACMIVQIVINL